MSELSERLVPFPPQKERFDTYLGTSPSVRQPSLVLGQPTWVRTNEPFASGLTILPCYELQGTSRMESGSILPTWYLVLFTLVFHSDAEL